MALEVEYVDMDTFENVVSQTDDPVDMINGDGSAEAVADVFDGEAKEVAADIDDAEDNQADGTVTIIDDTLDEMEIEERRRLAESQHATEISATKEEHFSLAVKRSELENELKDIKADEKAALKNLRNLIKRGPNYPQAKSKIDEAVETAGEKSAIQVDDPAADTSWRSVPTSQIISGIKGMGDKKAEAIISLAPTLGDLEELRAKAGLVFKPFGSVLPRGIGGNMADEIENRIADFWAARQKQVAAETVDGAEQEQPEVDQLEAV